MTEIGRQLFRSDASTCLNNGVRDGPLEKLWGRGGGWAKYRKKIHVKENEVKEN